MSPLRPGPGKPPFVWTYASRKYAYSLSTIVDHSLDVNIGAPRYVVGSHYEFRAPRVRADISVERDERRWRLLVHRLDLESVPTAVIFKGKRSKVMRDFH